MKLLLDQNLSWRLVKALQGSFPESAHVREFGLDRAADVDVWEYARREGFVIGFGAWIVIGIAGDSMIRERGETLIRADIVYLLLLFLAVIYFHWLFRVFVMPLSGLPESATRCTD